jgi:hypothetical protein
MATKNTIRAGYALPGAGVPNSEPIQDYSRLIGKRITLDKSGENESFDRHLPRTGTVVRQIGLEDWGRDWLVLRFDEPFDYDGGSVRECLVRARWSGCPIGSDFSPVFVLTDPRNALGAKQVWASGDFNFVSWGEVRTNA